MRKTFVFLALLALPLSSRCKPLTNPAGICEQIISSKPARWCLKLGPWVLCAVLFYKVRNLQKKMAAQEEQERPTHGLPPRPTSHNTYNLSPSLSRQLQQRGSLSSLELSNNPDTLDAIPDVAEIDLASLGGTDKFNVKVSEHFKFTFLDEELTALKTNLSVSNIAEQIAKKIQGSPEETKKRVLSVFSEHIKVPDLASN